MGNASSGPPAPPPPPPKTPAEIQAEEDAAEIAKEKAENEAEIATENVEVAEQDRQEKEVDRATARDNRKSKRLDEAKAARGFRRPPPMTEPLTIKNSQSCDACRVIVDPTLSSATVVLSRTVLGKMRPPGLTAPASNLPFPLKPDGSIDYDNLPTKGKGWMERIPYEVPYNSADGNPDHPKTDKSVAKGTLLSDRQYYPSLMCGVWNWFYIQQVEEEKKNLKKWVTDSLKYRVVPMWNPSDDPVDKYGSHAINYNNYGALTKLFLKPTIPFQITYDPTGTLPIPEPSVRNIPDTSQKPTIPGPPEGPTVKSVPEL
jgi:hypothetical protein